MVSLLIGKSQFLVAILILLNLFVSEAYAGSCRQLCDEHFMRTASKEMIEKEIQWGADINEIDKETGKNALHTASIVGNSTAIRILLKNGVDINAPHFQGGGALSFASLSGSVEAMKILVGAGANINGLASRRGAPLILAAMSGKIRTVRFLLDKGADHNLLFEGSFGALAAAASNGRLGIMTLLLEAGAKVNAGAGTDGSPIWAAMLQNSVAAIELLIKNGANVNITGRRERPLLVEAIGLTIFGRIEPQTVELLLAGGANPNVRGIRGKSALSLVLRGKGKENQLLRILLENGAKPNETIDNKEPYMPPIFMTVFSSNIEGTKFLIDAGADVKKTFSDGSTMLHLAAETGSAEMVQLLLSSGADPTIKNNGGLTPLDVAVNYKKLDAIKVLINAGKP